MARPRRLLRSHGQTVTPAGAQRRMEAPATAQGRDANPEDMANLKASVAGLQTSVAGLQTSVAGLQTSMAGLQTSFVTAVADIKISNEKTICNAVADMRVNNEKAVADMRVNVENTRTQLQYFVAGSTAITAAVVIAASPPDSPVGQILGAAAEFLSSTPK